MRGKIRKTMLVLTGIVLSLTILEIGLRLAGRIYKEQYTVSVVSRPDSINILCLGESTTTGLWVQPEDSYPKQLERMLNRHYKTDRIQAIIPFHMGQNSSQIANRVEEYLKLYRPKLVLTMIGVNNEWSFAENNFVLFLKGNDSTIWKLRLNALCDRLRILKVVRFAYRKYATQGLTPDDLSGSELISGAPENDHFPPEDWKSKPAKEHQQAFTSGWSYDVRSIIHKSKKNAATVILMNYHFNPPFLKEEAIERIAKEEGVPFLFNQPMWHRAVLAKNLRKQFVMHDGWHPNRKGYALIARNVFQLIRRLDLLHLEE